MSEGDQPEVGSSSPLPQTHPERASNYAGETQRGPSPAVGDDLDVVPIDVIGRQGRRESMTHKCIGARRPGLDERLLGGPAGGQMLDLGRMGALSATSRLTALAGSEGTFCEDGAGLSQLLSEAGDVDEVQTTLIAH